MANAASNPSTSLGLFDVLSTAFTRFKEYRTRRALFVKTRDELQSLNARDLADLGISRSGITSIAYESAYKQ